MELSLQIQFETKFTVSDTDPAPRDLWVRPIYALVRSSLVFEVATAALR